MILITKQVFDGPAIRANREPAASRRQVAEATWYIIITDIIRFHLYADESITNICGSFELIGCKGKYFIINTFQLIVKRINVMAK